MASFIRRVLLDLKASKPKLDDVHFILPSRRAGLVLKRELSKVYDAPFFIPKISSVEDFISELSDLKLASNTELLFYLYKAYEAHTATSELETFDVFSSWGSIVLQDFNEIDRYLVEQDNIFDYLMAIKELDHWSLQASEQTDVTKGYIKFWRQLKLYYQDFVSILKSHNKAYQGLVYREAYENLEYYIDNTPQKHHIFVGFNALNKAESYIFQEILQGGLGRIYWDIDSVFVHDSLHSAGMFVRQYRDTWRYFKNAPFKWFVDDYKDSKTVKVIGVPKTVSQAKYVGNLLDKISSTNPKFKDLAVVLGNENLLIPLLNSFPESVKSLNITMGLPLRQIPLAFLFDRIFQLHKKSKTKFYYKDILSIIQNSFLTNAFITHSGNVAVKISQMIQERNTTYLDLADLKAMVNEKHKLLQVLFEDWGNNPLKAIANMKLLIQSIKLNYSNDKAKNQLELEYLFRFNRLFNQLETLNHRYHLIDSISILHTIYKELLNSETLDFQGNPLDGLQVMGMLESRVLDFDTVIITGVNEGILPAGKTQNSFIPFDVKVENGLPTFKEKDAVYTYHFYRLLQRAKTVYLIYDTEVDTLSGGEKSRFITQLETEGIHNIEHSIATPEIKSYPQPLKTVNKSEEVLERLKQIAEKGFSPSSLSNYIRNPIDFYYEKILGIKDFEDVEETVAASTLGSVIHNTLEEFYKPVEGQELTVKYLEGLKPKIKTTVKAHFDSLYYQGDLTKGKNLIVYEIAQHYITSFIDKEIQALQKGDVIKIIAIEVESNIELDISELNFPIHLTGKVDRIDILNGTTRIIDYKTGKVEQSKVEIVDWEDLTTDYDRYSKSFQILCYSYMMHRKNEIELPVQAGIISFKNLNSGFLKFSKKDAPKSRKKDDSISEETLANFEKELKALILEICNPTIAFTEKKIEK